MQELLSKTTMYQVRLLEYGLAMQRKRACALSVDWSLCTVH